MATKIKFEPHEAELIARLQKLGKCPLIEFLPNLQYVMLSLEQMYHLFFVGEASTLNLVQELEQTQSVDCRLVANLFTEYHQQYHKPLVALCTRPATEGSTGAIYLLTLVGPGGDTDKYVGFVFSKKE